MDEKPLSRDITTLHKYKTDFNADSVEWCPHEPHQNVFVCANYQLKDSQNEGPRERFGRILLFSVTPEALVLMQTIETAAVLDQKWCHSQIQNVSILGVVNAHKTLEIYKLDPELIKLELLTSYTIQDDESETLLLSLDWSTGKYQQEEQEIVCSDSKGNIHRFKLISGDLIKEASYAAHEFEAWITGFYYWDPKVIFSGGDDSCFLKFDTRVGEVPVARNRSHEAGVTSMHSNAEKEFLLITGSYDSSVRLWDIRKMKNCLNSVKMPGTLWRLKWDPFYYTNLLAACMLGGVHIINFDNKDLKIVDSYYKHDNIAYGADWCFSKAKNLIASCSFYDNLLCVSQVKIKK